MQFPSRRGILCSRLIGFGNDNGIIDALVIKQEAGHTGQAVGFAATFMNLVDRNARTLLLTPQEITELKAWSAFFSTHGSPSGVPDQGTARELLTRLNGQGAWTKMEVKRLTMLDDAIKHQLDGDKADVRVIARALKKHGGLEKLGEIIAVDLFNGNNDRIVWITRGQKHPGFPFAFKTLGNIGNVFFACGANGRGTPIGLDGFDPYNTYKDASIAVDPQQPSQPPTNFEQHLWSGWLLTSQFTKEKKRFAGDVIEDLEMAFGPRHRKNPFGSQKRLGNNRKDRLLAGMASAEKKLKTALIKYKGSHPQLPPGLSSRMNILGW